MTTEHATCLRCGRPLKNKASRKRGYGKLCFKESVQLKLFDEGTKKPAPKAFTLVELLIVICVITILIGIFMPGLGGAREQARRTKCLSNESQIGILVTAYANENRDFMPWDNGDLAYILRRKLESSYGVLCCPSDTEDRVYSDGSHDYATAAVFQPRTPSTVADVVSYNISYAYMTPPSRRIDASSFVMWGDETNGPDVTGWEWYGDGHGGAITANSEAAGTLPGTFAGTDNHKAFGGNFLSNDGSARWFNNNIHWQVLPGWDCVD